MEWKDIEGSTDLAEALGLLASFVAAVIALRDAQKEQTSAENENHEGADVSSAPEADSQIVDPLHVNVPAGLGKSQGLLKHSHLVKVVAGLALVVVFQLAILVFIAYKLL